MSRQVASAWVLAACFLAAAYTVLRADAAPPYLQVGVMLPLNGSQSFYDATCWRGAIELGVAAINDDPNVLPNTRMVTHVSDTTGVRGTAVIKTMELMCQTAGKQAGVNCNVSGALIGPCYSATALASQAVADVLDVTQVSPTASDPSLSDKTNNPTFSRTRSPVQFEGAVLAEFVIRTGWTSINTMYSAHPLDVATVTAFDKALLTNITLKSTNMYQKRNNEARVSASNPIFSLENHIQDVKSSGSYVTLLSIRSWDIPTVFGALRDAGMLSPPWVYIIPTSVMASLDFYTDFNPWYQGIVGLYNPAANNTSPEYLAFRSAWDAAGVSCGGHTTPSLNSRRSYDAALLVGKGYHEALKVAEADRGANALPTTEEFTQAIRSVKFVGASGEIALTPEGDRLPDLGIGYMPGSADTETSLFPIGVGLYKPLTGLQVDMSRIVWPGGSTAMPRSSPAPFEQSQALEVFGVILACLGIVEAITFSAAAIVLRKQKTMRWSSPVFMQLICFGGVSACVGVLVYTLAPVTRVTCAVVVWVPSLSGFLIMGCLFAKTHRIHKLFNNKSLKKLVISDLDVVKRVAVIVLAELAFLTVWWVFDPWVPVDVETLATANGERFTYKRCDSVDGSSVRWEIANAFGRLALSTWGAFLAFETRRVPAGFNESRYILLAIYNALLVEIVAGGLSIVLRETPSAVLLLRAFGEVEPVIFVLAVLFGPKLYYIRKNKQHDDSLRGGSRGKGADNQKLIQAQTEVAKLRKTNRELDKTVKQLKKQLATPAPFNVHNPLLAATNGSSSPSSP